MTRALIIKLNKNNYSKHDNNVHGTQCIHCGKQLNIGEKAVSKLVTHVEGKTYLKKRALYCIPCADELNII